MTALATREEKRLAELEAVVDRGVQTFVEVGQALGEIRDAHLYKLTHDTFDSYVRDRWGWARQTALGYISAAGVANNVSRARHLPSIDHARILAPLEPKEQRALAPVIADLPRIQAREVVRRYRENGTALRDVKKLADEVISADAYLQFLAVMRDVLGLVTLKPEEIFAGVSSSDIQKSVTSVKNATRFLEDCLILMRQR